MRTLRVADLEAKPGEKVSGFVHIIGAEFGIPVTLICGEKEGETVLISGGVHNAEYVGIQAAMQLADELDPKKIAGNIIVIRLMNRTGFEHRTMSLTYEDGKNLNRVFPGNPNGTLSDRIAYTVVTEFFQKADYYVDLHCGDGFEGLVSYVYCTGAAASEVAAKSREMAEIAHVDYDFAKKFGIDIIEVIKGGDISKEAYTGDGEMVNSDFLNGYAKKKDSIERMLEELEKKGIGKAGVQYKMKDWAFNRQRYWGEPIPLIHCPNCGVVAVPENELPLRLPDVKDFEPGEDGQSPLAKIDSFVNCTCPKCGAAAKRETDTMPQWAGSSWYFLRYTDPHNANALADMDKLKYWMPVDWYNGGMEHVTRHMIYSRFWHHFLYDLGVVNTPEPYAKRSIQGLILGPDGDKMSKSKGNVVDPLDIVEEYGADTLRTYVLFMGDYGAATPWSENSVKGCKKFLDRVAGLTDILSEESVSDELEMKLHRTIKKVSSDIENLKFNTAIASLMTLINEITAEGHLSKDDLTIFIKLLSPFAPHICEEIWEFIGGEGLLAVSEWPKYDEGKTIAKTVEIGVQVNGKVRGTIVIPNGCEKEKAFEIAKADERIASFLEGKNLIKEIYVPNKIVNFVAK